MASNNILVFIEQNNNQIAEVSLELLGKAAELANQLNVAVDAVVLGYELKPQLTVLGTYGCDRVYYVNAKRLAHFTTLPYAKMVVTIIKKYNPQIVLFGATIIGRDLAPRVASELRCGLTADCTDLQIGDYQFKGQSWENILLQIRPAFGGNIVATIVSPDSRPSMATVREGVMKLPEPNSSRAVNIIEEESVLVEQDFLTQILKVVREEKRVNLKAAKIVVAVGMGAASAEALELITELAKILNAELGCSRPVADAGLVAIERQIGQTGTTIRPNLYIACGISGQIQHTAGMVESKRIIAINSDPVAPIFKIAHYGVVGEVKAVVSKMIKAYKTKL